MFSEPLIILSRDGKALYGCTQINLPGGERFFVMCILTIWWGIWTNHNKNMTVVQENRSLDHMLMQEIRTFIIPQKNYKISRVKEDSQVNTGSATLQVYLYGGVFKSRSTET